MTQAEFDAWVPRAIREYAQEHVVDGRWSEEEAIDKSRAETIRLHVFGHNAAARPLYVKLGYEPTNIVMAKS
jgi:ribosomal protein S18 acetylase RimI-like enzyme